MALTLAACYPEVFAAVGVHSAPPYRSAGHGRDALAAMQGRRAVPPPAPSARMAPADSSRARRTRWCTGAAATR